MPEGSQSRIAIVLPQLRGAGIQRMRLQLARYFLADGHEVDLVVGRRKGELVDMLPPGANVHEVAAKGALWFFLGFLGYQLKRRPTHVMTSNDDTCVMVSLSNYLTGKSACHLASNHNAYGHVRMERGWLGRLKHFVLQPMFRLSLRGADAVVAVSQGVASELEDHFGMDRGSIHIVYNPVIDTDVIRRLEDPKERAVATELPVIGYFGRLHPQKRVDILIRAFAKLHAKQPANLLLVGEGEESERLKMLVSELSLGGNVTFHGFADDPYPLMKQCAVVALSSDYEGFGNVLVEAMACGTQVVSTDCPHGPSEILDDGRWGQLVPVGDEVGLASALSNALSGTFRVDPDDLRARASAFTVDAAASQYLLHLGLRRHDDAAAVRHGTGRSQSDGS